VNKEYNIDQREIIILQNIRIDLTKMAFQAKEGEVIEGFLCPICMEDLVSITLLQAHFEEKHESEDKAVLKFT
ncbi:hypothetical protein Avbf_17449, partial [Armadillidium vulgare]